MVWGSHLVVLVVLAIGCAAQSPSVAPSVPTGWTEGYRYGLIMNISASAFVSTRTTTLLTADYPATAERGGWKFLFLRALTDTSSEALYEVDGELAALTALHTAMSAAVVAKVSAWVTLLEMHSVKNIGVVTTPAKTFPVAFVVSGNEITWDTFAWLLGAAVIFLALVLSEKILLFRGYNAARRPIAPAPPPPLPPASNVVPYTHHVSEPLEDDTWAEKVGGGSNPAAAAGAVVVVSSPASASAQQPVTITRGAASLAVMVDFLTKVMSTEDRCSVTAFNSAYKMLTMLSDEASAKAALVSQQHCFEGETSLYDACVVSVMQFAKTANKSRPWVLIILTDGEDTMSRLTLIDACNALKSFNQPDSNFTVIVSLGELRSLEQLAENSDSVHIPIQKVESLQYVFGIIALSVVQGYRITANSVNNAGAEPGAAEKVWAQVEEVASLQRNPVDMLILMDVSESMAESLV